MSPHSCGWCARWLELREAHDEGRALEARIEAKRLLGDADAVRCVLALRTVLALFPETWDEHLTPIEAKIMRLQGIDP
jgi:hypothetical protein